LKGKCGRCEFKKVCSGCRARAYAAQGTNLAEEPYCIYMPKNEDSHDPARMKLIKNSSTLHSLKFHWTHNPFRILANKKGTTEEEVIRRMQRSS
jgi:hypothetical protein